MKERALIIAKKKKNGTFSKQCHNYNEGNFLLWCISVHIHFWVRS